MPDSASMWIRTLCPPPVVHDLSSYVNEFNNHFYLGNFVMEFSTALTCLMNVFVKVTLVL